MSYTCMTGVKKGYMKANAMTVTNRKEIIISTLFMSTWIVFAGLYVGQLKWFV